jgi:predicted small lipoprotein YifL
MTIRHCTHLLLIVLLLSGLPACGQKGDLYLPDDREGREERRQSPQR